MSDKDDEKSALIIPFPRKRGRPKSNMPKRDYGTPELRLKRMRGETAETLDLCLERGIINEQQHWCGIHLRWLFTLRNGAPGARTVDPSHFGGTEIKNDDPEWRTAREQEYHEAIAKLKNYVHLVTNICIYNDRPSYLNKRINARGETGNITQLRDGLDILVKLWCKRPKG